MVLHTYNRSTQEAREEDGELVTSLDCITRPFKTTKTKESKAQSTWSDPWDGGLGSSIGEMGFREQFSQSYEKQNVNLV